MKKKAKDIKSSVYALGKAPENLTQNQQAKKEMFARTEPILYKEYVLKERLRLALKQVDEDTTKQEIDSFFWCSTHSGIPIFKNLAYKIRRHENNILNTVKTNLRNARIEDTNNKIKLFIRKAYGFRNIQNLIDMVLLGCSNLFMLLPIDPEEVLNWRKIRLYRVKF